jgi:hypothetical protein
VEEVEEEEDTERMEQNLKYKNCCGFSRVWFFNMVWPFLIKSKRGIFRDGLGVQVLK